MPDFVPGDVLETRRGGVDVLRHLARELATLERNGSIQILRNIPEVGQRIGHLLIFDGSLAAAFHNADVERYGIEALLEIESDASALDATMSLHEMTEPSYISTLSEHPQASLISPTEEDRDDAWWTTVRSTPKRFDREERLPELKPSVAVPEALRRKSEARLKNQGGPVLRQGQAWLEHSIEPDQMFEFAQVVIDFAQPVLLISRQSPSKMKATHNIDMQHYRWLSETEHDRTLEPSLESIRRNIDQFYEQHQQSILILEGIEYLSGIHGEQRVIEMIRSVVDQTRANGNVLMVSSNLEAFTSQHRSRLEREFSTLASQQLQTWLLDVDLLREHPFFSEIDEEVEIALAKHLEENVQDIVLLPKPEIHSIPEQVPLPIVHQTMKVDEDLQSKMRSWATGEVESTDGDMKETKATVLPKKQENQRDVKPRTPQRIVRKRKQHTQREKESVIAAAAKRGVEISNLSDEQYESTKPFVPTSTNIEHTLPELKPSLSQKGMKMAAASKSTKRQVKFPPIKSTKQVAVPLPNSERNEIEIQPSPHAREHAAHRQSVVDESDSEDGS